MKTSDRKTRSEMLEAEKRHDERMAARLDESVNGDPSDHFTIHVPSPGQRGRSRGRAVSTGT